MGVDVCLQTRASRPPVRWSVEYSFSVKTKSCEHTRTHQDYFAEKIVHVEFSLFPPGLPLWTFACTVFSELLGFCFFPYFSSLGRAID